TRSIFFFSSRRRHTRSYGDWSSDVCSSDLALARDTAQLAKNLQVAWHQVEGLVTSLDSLHRAPLTPAVRRYAEACGAVIDSCSRSEERRVGKECRSRRWQYHY